MTIDIRGATCLVTGYGFVSRHLVQRLLREGADVTVIEKAFVPDRILDSKSKILNMEIRDLTDRLEFDYTFHLAAVANPGYAERSPIDAIEANILGTLALLQRVKTRKMFLFSSSSNVYGESTKQLSEMDATRPINVYGVTKLAAEELIRVYGRKVGLNYTILRFFTLYGPGAAPIYIIPQICIQALRDRNIVIRDGTVRRDFLYVEDAVDLILCIVKSGIRNEVVNVGYGEATSILDVAVHLSRMINGGPIPVQEKGIKDLQSPPAQIADISKAKSLGWTPHTTLEQGLRKTLDYYMTSLGMDSSLG